jgi:hypothetical protein
MGFILVLYTSDVAMMQVHFIYNMFILSFVLAPSLFIENSVRHGLILMKRNIDMDQMTFSSKFFCMQLIDC